jgi:hypothetical protein
VDFAKEELNDYGEDPEKEVVDKVVHRSQRLLLSGSLGRHDEQMRLKLA